MTDVLTKSQRSFNMSHIRGRDTKPEIKFRELLFARGIKGYRVNYKLTGRPDVVFTKKKLAVFIDGCFWHKCKKCFVKPATRTDFWMKKIEGNLMRDKLINRQLQKEEWRVLRFWEHQLRKKPERIVLKIISSLNLTD